MISAIRLAVPSTIPRVLLADDQRDILEALQLLLKSEGFQVQSRLVAGGRACGRSTKPTSTRR